MGQQNGELIAIALGVTIYDLGAPREEESADGAVLRGILELKALLLGREDGTAAEVARLLEKQAEAMKGQAHLLAELSEVVADLRAITAGLGRPGQRTR